MIGPEVLPTWGDDLVITRSRGPHPYSTPSFFIKKPTILTVPSAAPSVQ